MARGRPIAACPRPSDRRALMATTNDAAAQFAAECYANGDPRRDTVAALIELFGVSRATAYRLVAAAATGHGATQADSPIIRCEDGSVDILGEAERQYAAAVADCDPPGQLRWFAILRKLRQAQ